MSLCRRRRAGCFFIGGGGASKMAAAAAAAMGGISEQKIQDFQSKFKVTQSCKTMTLSFDSNFPRIPLF